MMHLKQLISEKKNVILVIIAIILIIFTAYQLKLVGIAIAEDAEIVETAEVSETEVQAISQSLESAETIVEEVQTENIIEEITIANIVNTEILSNVVDNEILLEVEQIQNTIVNESKISNLENVIGNTITKVENSITNILDDNLITNKENVIDEEINITNTVELDNISDIEISTTIENKSTNATDVNLIESEEVEVIENIPSELVFENEEYKVTVSAIKDDALKNIEKVNVTPITVETNVLEYNKISEKLQNKFEEENATKSKEEQSNLVGFLAYDITLVNKAGLEVEPDGNVNVSFEYITVPEKVAELANAEVSVVHFEEDKIDGNISLKEFSQDEQALSVQTNDVNQVTKLDFETASFSTFTITWSANNSRTAKITVHYVDENNVEIQGTQINNVNASTGTYTFSNYAGAISNYTYKEARLDSYTGTVVTTVRFSSNYNQYKVTFSDGTSETISRNQTIEYDIYLIYESNNVGSASSSVPIGSTVSISANNISNSTITDLVGFSWTSNNTSIAIVTVDGATGIPTVKGITAGQTTIIGTRVVDGVTQTINWNITVESQTTSQIIFEHQEQDNTSFANQDSYRPYSEYGYSSTEATNIVKFIVVLADKDGALKMNGDNPDVTLPDGSIVPETYVFDLGSDKTLSIGENSFDGISVPGYSYAGTYAYFGWSSNRDTDDMAVVSTFRNFGRVSTDYPNYYSVIGFSTSRGIGDDYSSETFGSAGTGYYAYNPTGVLMIVLKPVSEDVSYRTYYHNSYNPGGTAVNNIVDTTLANMVQGEWVSDEYRYEYYGETIMTTIDTSTLVGPVGYKFVGWYDNVDAEGNGTGNLVTTSDDNMVGTSYYALIDGEKIIITQNNNIYARWEVVTGNLTIQKTISGGLNPSEIATVANQIQFVVKNDSGEIVATILPTDLVWNNNIGIYTISNLPVNTPYTVEENNQDITGHIVETSIIYPNEGNYAQISSEDEIVTISVENKYSTRILIKKVNPFGEVRSGASFEITELGRTETRIISDSDDGSDDGNINISLLKYNTEYVITEIIAPNGYYRLEMPIHIKITEVNGEDTITILNSAEISEYVSIENGALRVVNVQHVLMPKAGGCGIYWYYLAGILIMGCSLMIYLKNTQRKEN